MRALIPILAAACASAGAGSSYGVVPRKDIFGPSARAGVLQVGPGRVVGDDLDLREENGCVNGYYARRAISFCRDDQSQGPEEHWSGPSGDFFLKREGNLYQVSGNVLTGGATLPINQSIPLNASNGKGWQELLNHPALLAVLSNLPAIR
ncbi:MAG: hypothetical protein ABR567_06565 [Myxococcales bacterium]